MKNHFRMAMLFLVALVSIGYAQESGEQLDVAADSDLVVSEDASIGTLVGTFTATEQDGSTATVTWSLLDAGSLFSINSSGQLTTAAALDYESATTHTFTVQADRDSEVYPVNWTARVVQ